VQAVQNLRVKDTAEALDNQALMHWLDRTAAQVDPIAACPDLLARMVAAADELTGARHG
jgi:hypothetical protein